MYLPETSEPKKKEFSGDTFIDNLEQQRYYLGQIQKVDKERRRLQMQVQLLTEQRDKLQSSIDRMRQPPLITAQLISSFEDGRAIVKSSTGPQFVVQTSPVIPEETLVTGAQVALNQRTFAVVEVLPPSTDPFIRGMEVGHKATKSCRRVTSLKWIDRVYKVK